MSEVHPELLYQLQQIRAHELQQAAACARFLAQQHQVWTGGWKWNVLPMAALIAKAALLFTSRAKKPVESCC